MNAEKVAPAATSAAVQSEELSREERVRALYEKEKKSYREIAKAERISLRDIARILKEGSQANRPGESTITQVARKQSAPAKDPALRAYSLFERRKTDLEVARALGIASADVILKYRQDYWRLKGITALCRVHEEVGDKGIWTLVNLRRSMREKGLDIDRWTNLMNSFEDLLLENSKMQRKGESLQRVVSELEERKRVAQQELQDLLQKIQSARTEFSNISSEKDQATKDLERIRGRGLLLNQLIDVKRFYGKGRKINPKLLSLPVVEVIPRPAA